jgi:3'-phosphoadenosine 5'-phosphosulfate sulfotransferase (PAPS reductase)/FAD synthetase
MKPRREYYEPTADHLDKLAGDWCASYSGGKDSTALVTWVEWLRRSGQIQKARPQLVRCDTDVEDTSLSGIAEDLSDILRKSGWECAVVQPRLKEKLYNRILGIGNTPVHPGGRTMRWCTRATKIDPMDRWRAEHSSGLVLTGLRYGESTMRDGKLKKIGCAAGGECGIPEASAATYSPIINWRTCFVIDWLNGHVPREIADIMHDVFAVTNRLVDIYDVSFGQDGFEDWAEPEISVARFGCIGCPAISADRMAPRSTVKRNGHDSPLNEIYDVWFEARRRDNRLVKPGRDGRGPIRMSVRKVLFDRIMDIQRRAGVVLITPEDEAFIRQCWADKVYPRGWSYEDEVNEPPCDTPLFGAEA